MKTVRIEKEPDSSDVLGRLWKNRDFELQHLWQRSIFLTAFLSLCLVGYGRLILSVFENHYSPPKMLAVNLVAVGICLLGTVFSFLWVAMARGSKSWYEWYEFAIRHYCATSFSANPEMDKYLTPEHLATLKLSCKTQVECPIVSDCIFALHGGPFSPSKINVLIGYIAAISFSGLAVGHCFFCIGLCFDPYICLRCFKEWKVYTGCAFVVVSCALAYSLARVLWPFTTRFIRSSSLSFLLPETESNNKKCNKTIIPKQECRCRRMFLRKVLREIHPRKGTH